MNGCSWPSPPECPCLSGIVMLKPTSIVSSAHPIYLFASVPSLSYIPSPYSAPCLAPHELNLHGSCSSHSSLVQPHLPPWMTHSVCFLNQESHNGCTAGHGDFLIFGFVTGNDMQLSHPPTRDLRKILFHTWEH